jgi:hypothetical protein
MIRRQKKFRLDASFCVPIALCRVLTLNDNIYRLLNEKVGSGAAQRPLRETLIAPHDVASGSLGPVRCGSRFKPGDGAKERLPDGTFHSRNISR